MKISLLKQLIEICDRKLTLQTELKERSELLEQTSRQVLQNALQKEIRSLKLQIASLDNTFVRSLESLRKIYGVFDLSRLNIERISADEKELLLELQERVEKIIKG